MDYTKLKTEFAEDLKVRKKTFKRRTKGLTKKLVELTTLCDIGACMVIYEPTLNQSSVCPNDKLIEAYRSRIAEVKSCGVSDFLVEEKKKVEKELLKLRKTNSEAKYPTASNDVIDSMDEAQLRGFAGALHNRAMMIRSRIHLQMQREMHDRHQLEMMHLNHRQFLINPAAAIGSYSYSNNSYMNMNTTNIVPYIMNNYYDDQNQNQNQNQNYYNVDDQKNNMMLLDGATEYHTNIAYSSSGNSWSTLG